MYLENLALDALDPQRVGRFWEALLGGRTLTDQPDLFETRVTFSDAFSLDLCVQRVPEPPTEPLRLHPDLTGGARQAQVVQQALAGGARHVDIGQGSPPWVVLGDPEGNPFCVMEDRPEYRDRGPIAALPLDSGDPERDARFWSVLSGWGRVPSASGLALQHPSGGGPLLELCLEAAPRDEGKNRWHLDLRLERGDDPDAVLARALELGGSEPDPDGGALPWRVLADPSGNVLCLLPARRR